MEQVVLLETRMHILWLDESYCTVVKLTVIHVSNSIDYFKMEVITSVKISHVHGEVGRGCGVHAEVVRSIPAVLVQG